MKEGKMSNGQLQSAIIDQLAHSREDVLIGPGIGEDCAAIAFGDMACVLTTDPITGATKDIGKIAVHVSCNDIASSGVRPAALLMTLLLPLDATAEDASQIMRDAHQVASQLNVAIIGGHTEFTSAVRRPVVSVTAIGKGLRSELSATAGAVSGDLVVMSKWAGIEGTAIIANEKAEELRLQGMREKDLQSAIGFFDALSVLEEGVLGGKHGVHAMHDVTEGGILGALWEMCEASGLGAVIELDQIPIRPETKFICERYQIDPLRLISSGSMLAAVPQANFEAYRSEAQEKGVALTVIGQFTDSPEVLMRDASGVKPVAPPDVDELYKVFQ